MQQNDFFGFRSTVYLRFASPSWFSLLMSNHETLFYIKSKLIKVRDRLNWKTAYPFSFILKRKTIKCNQLFIFTCEERLRIPT